MTEHVRNSETPIPQLHELAQAQRDRLAYIELKLWFVGELRRHDLATRFGVKTAAATRDFGLYKSLAPGNIEYDGHAKSYVIGPAFSPLFDFSAQRVLAWLADGFGDGEPVCSQTGVTCDIPSRLGQPALDTLAHVTRAISRRCPLKLTYYSIENGRSERVIVPFALLDNGLRWHVRAFDRQSGEFRDFVITRIEQPELLTGEAVHAAERADQDIQWARIVELELVPHPNQPRPEITCMDYGLVDGVLRLKLRAATAGYVLRKWNVDCSPDHSLRGAEYRLWLRDPLALYGVRNAVLAPGYQAPAKAQPNTRTRGK